MSNAEIFLFAAFALLGVVVVYGLESRFNEQVKKLEAQLELFRRALDIERDHTDKAISTTAQQAHNFAEYRKEFAALKHSHLLLRQRAKDRKLTIQLKGPPPLIQKIKEQLAGLS